MILEDYLGLNVSEDKIYKTKIPEEGFELLLQVMAILEPTQRLINHIRKNMPSNFDMTKLSEEFSGMIERTGSCHKIAILHQLDQLCLYDVCTLEVIDIINISHDVQLISPNGTYAIVCTEDKLYQVGSKV